MLTFIVNGVMINGLQAPHTFAGPLASKPASNEYWVKQRGSGTQNRGGLMRPGRMRTLAVMARALNAAARSRMGRRSITSTLTPTTTTPIPIA